MQTEALPTIETYSKEHCLIILLLPYPIREMGRFFPFCFFFVQNKALFVSVKILKWCIKSKG